MSRKLLISIHLILASLFMPLLLMMPLTGSLYILGAQGDQTKTEAFRVTDPVPEDETSREAFFREQFAKNHVDYHFEYIRGNAKEFTFRPTSKTHYAASKQDDGTYLVSKIEPTLLKRLIELHKGHGPLLMRWFEVLFGLALILTTLSGLWLAWTVKPYRRTTLISFAIGCALIAACLI